MAGDGTGGQASADDAAGGVDAAVIARARTYVRSGTEPVFPTERARERLAESLRRLGADEDTVVELTGR
jgi:hypothetical protein